jgi:Holliday junction resolvasome RuvABC DNA-binding subunit
LPELHASELDASSHDVIDALVALGYSESASRDVMRTLDASLDTQTKIREGLKMLNGK